MTAKEAATGEHLETAPGTRGGRFKRHCARRWWIYLIGIIIFIVVLVIIIIFAIIPAVAQKTLDKTTLKVESLSILDPTPDQFSLSLESHITGGGKLASHVKLDPMDVDFSLNGGDPFLTVPLPEVHGSDSILIEKVNYTASISNKDTFQTFASTLMDSEEFTLDVNGKTKLRMGSLKMNVKYRESVTLKGLNKLQGMEIIDYTLILNETDHNMQGIVVIPNPSVFTIQTGDVPLKIGYNGSPLGTGLLPNLILQPGLEGQYKFQAKLDIDKLTKAMAQFLAGTAVLDIGADGAKVNGIDIPWLSKPLSSLVTKVPVKARGL